MKYLGDACKLVGSLVASIVSLGAAPGSGEEILAPAVREALDAAPAALVPLSLDWERSRVHEKSVDETLRQIKYKRIQAGELGPYQVQFRCDRGKYFCRIRRSTVNIKAAYADGRIEMDEHTPMRAAEDEASFDGEVCYLGNGVELQKETGGIPMLRKSPLKDAKAYFLSDYLGWAGYDVPRTPREIPKGLRSRVLEDLASGQLVSQEEGTMSHSIDIKTGNRAIHYDLACEFGYAVRERREKTGSGELATVATCSDYVKLAGRNVWLPQTISVVWHTWGTIPQTFEKDPIMTERFELRSWDIAPIDHEEFVLDYNVPGAAISDSVVKGAEKFEGGYVDYRVPADPAQLDDAIASALDKPKRVSSFPFFAIANVLAVLIVVSVVAVKWNRRSTK